MPGLVNEQPATVQRFGLVGGGEELEGPGLPFHRGLRIARLGAGGRQGAQALGVFPVREFGGARPRLHGLPAITYLPRRARCKEPGEMLITERVPGISPDSLREISGRRGPCELAF